MQKIFVSFWHFIRHLDRREVINLNDFSEIYRLYANDVYRYLLKCTGKEDAAEELTQETFLRAIQKIHTFRGETSIKAWLIVIAKNCYCSAMRSPWKYPQELDENIASDSADDSLFDSFADRETARRIHVALHHLNEPYKEVFSLRVFGELQFKDIAELFGKTESWAKVTFYRAKSQILNAINKEDAK